MIKAKLTNEEWSKYLNHFIERTAILPEACKGKISKMPIEEQKRLVNCYLGIVVF